ncbi:hypothetical protein C806_02472 [Lachnospiraceae bacterium 3-1]|nr:hypothetical protein C806_02472 [Lachnospiraceae bacterium 3-1]
MTDFRKVFLDTFVLRTITLPCYSMDDISYEYWDEKNI